MSDILADLNFYIDVGEEHRDDPNSFTRCLSSAIASMGGEVAPVYDDQVTHVVLRHREQELYSAALKMDQSIVAPGFVLRCHHLQKLIEETEEGVHPASEIPGFAEHVREITQTDFRGVDRLMVRYKCQCTGARYSGVMTVPANTSHVVVKDLGTTSEKVAKARRHPSVHIVSIDWLDECLKQWKVLPEGPYALDGSQVESPMEEGGNAASPPPSTEPVAENDEPDLDPTLPIDDMLDDETTCAEANERNGTEQKVATPDKDEQQDDVQTKKPISLVPTEVASELVTEHKDVGSVKLSDADVPAFMLGSNEEDMDMSQRVAHAGSVIGQLASQLDITTQVQEEAQKEAAMADGEPTNAVEQDQEMVDVVDEAQDKNVPKKSNAVGDGVGTQQDGASLHGADPPMGLSMSVSTSQEEVVNPSQGADNSPPEAQVVPDAATKGDVGDKATADRTGVEPKEGVDPVDLEINTDPPEDVTPDGNAAAPPAENVKDLNTKAAEGSPDANEEGSAEQVNVAETPSSDIIENRTEDHAPADGNDSGQPDGDTEAAVGVGSDQSKGGEPEGEAGPSSPVRRRSQRTATRSVNRQKPPSRSTQRTLKRATKGQEDVEVDDQTPKLPRRSSRRGRQPSSEGTTEIEKDEPVASGGPSAATTRPRRGRAARASTAARSEPATPAPEGVRTRSRGASQSGQATTGGISSRGASKRKGGAQRVEEGMNDVDEPRAKAPRRSDRLRTPTKYVPQLTGEAKSTVGRPKRKASLASHAGSVKRAKAAPSQMAATPPVVKGMQSILRSRRRRRRNAQPDPVFAVSGMERTEKDEITEFLGTLGAKTVAGPHEPMTTHLVVPKLTRNEKTMCCMAQGSWILGTEYMQACRDESDLVRELPYEISASDDGVISTGAPAHWRTRFEEVGVGAFAGLEAFFYGTIGGPGGETLARIIQAGGGRVIRRTPPYTDHLEHGVANIAVIGGDKIGKAKDRTIKAFLDCGVACVSMDYIINWVAHPQASLEKDYLFGCKGTEELKKMETARGSVNAN